MANTSAVVGVLRAMLTADTAQFDTSMRKSAAVADTTSASIGGLGKEIAKLTPQAERMAKAFSGDRLTAQASNLVAAVEKIGGAQKLTQAEHARVNSTLAEAIAKYSALGKTAPQAMLDLEQATRRTVATTSQLGEAISAMRGRVSAQVAGFSGRDVRTEAAAVTRAVMQVGGAQRLTAAEQARVNATLTEAIAKYQAIGRVAPKAMLELEQATRKTVPPTQNLNLTLTDVGKSILTWAAGFVTAQAALNIFQAAVHNTVEEIKTLTIEGAAVGDVTENFERLTAGAKQSGAALLGELRAGTHATIDDLTLMKIVNQDLTAGLKLSQAQWSLLAKGGFALAQRDASSVTEGLEKLNQALLTGQIRTVKGIIGVINAEAAEKRYAASINTTREHLSDEGKLAALRVEIFRKLGLSIDRLGEQTDGLDEKVAQTQASWRNFQNELGRTVATSPVILAGLDALQEVLAKLVGGNKEQTVQNIGKAIDNLAIFLVEAAKVGIRSAGEIEKAWDGLKLTFGDLAQDIDRVRATFLLLKGAGSIVSSDSLGDAKEQFAELVKGLAKVGVSMANRAKDMDNLGAHQAKVDAGTQSYIDILDRAVARMRAAQASGHSLGSVLNDAGKATQGLTDDTEALTQASSEERAALKAYQEALESIHKSSTALAPVQQETIRLLNQAGVGSDTIAKALRLTTDEVNRAISAIQLYGRQYGDLDEALAGVTRSLQGLTTEQKAQIKAGLDAGLSVEEVTKKVNELNPALHLGTLAVKQFGDALKELDDIRADIFSVEEKALGNFQNVLEAEASARAQLAQTEFNKQQQIAGALAEIAGRRAQADIELAKMRGASVTEIAALERREAQRTLNAVLGGIAAETQARELEVQAIQDVIAATKAAGQEITPEQERALQRAQADLAAQREIARVNTQAAVEDFNLGERNKQEAIRRTTNVWIRAWDQMRSTSDGTIESVSRGIADLEQQTVGNLGTILFGFRDVDTSGLKRAAADAKQHFEEMKRSGRASAQELHDAFEEWRQKEEEANNTFAHRFKQLWHGIKSTIIDVLNDLLKYFTEQFIGGLIRGITGAKLGQTFGSQLAGAIPGAGGAGGSIAGLATNVGTSAGAGLLFGGGTAASMGSVFASGGMVAGGTAAGVAAGTGTIAASGPGLGAATGTGAGTGGGISFLSNPAFWTNPWTLGIGGGITLLTLAWKKGWFGLNKGSRGNDVRDKDLAQFAMYDTAADRQDMANPPGFHGLDRILTKNKRHDLFDPFVRANGPKAVRQAFAPIQLLMSTIGRQVKSYHTGGMVDEGAASGSKVARAVAMAGVLGSAVMPAYADAAPLKLNYGEVLIKALKGESVLTKEATRAIGGTPAVKALNERPSRSWMLPRPTPTRPMGGFRSSLIFQPPMVFHAGGTIGSQVTTSELTAGTAAPGVVQHITHQHQHTWNAIDGPSVRKFVNSDEFTHHLGHAFEFNRNFLTTRLTRGQRGMR